MTPEEIEKQKEIILGERAEEWWGSETGQYVIARSLAEQEELQRQIRSADPEDPKVIRNLQNGMDICEKALIWLNDAIIAGRQAAEEIDALESMGE